METENCPKCGSPMVARKNRNKGFYAACSTPEKHGEAVPKIDPAELPRDLEPEPVPQPEKKKRWIDEWI